MRLIFIFLLCLVLPKQHSAQDINIVDAEGNAITFDSKAIIIIATSMNCLGCYKKLADICKKSSTHVKKVYVLFDTPLIQPYERYQKIAGIESNFPYKNATYCFLAPSSASSHSTAHCTCDQTRSPFLILKNEDHIRCMCYNEIYSDSISKKDVLNVIKEFFTPGK